MGCEMPGTGAGNQTQVSRRAASILNAEPSLHLYFEIFNLSFFLFEEVPSYCRKVSGGKHMGAYVPRTKFFPLQVASDEETFYLFHKKDGMSLKIYYTVRYYE